MRDPINPLPNPELGQNPPKYRDPDAGSSVAGGVILAVAVAAVVAMGAIWYSMSDPTTTANNPAPSTVGQSTTPPAAPTPRMSPAPTPVPSATPAPAPKADSFKPGVDAEESPTAPKP